MSCYYCKEPGQKCHCCEEEMIADEVRKSQISQAFALGFMISRQGFNGECDYEHCGPVRLEGNHITIEDYLEYIEGDELFCTLRAKALSFIGNTSAGSHRQEEG